MAKRYFDILPKEGRGVKRGTGVKAARKPARKTEAAPEVKAAVPIEVDESTVMVKISATEVAEPKTEVPKVKMPKKPRAGVKMKTSDGVVRRTSDGIVRRPGVKQGPATKGVKQGPKLGVVPEVKQGPVARVPREPISAVKVAKKSAAPGIDAQGNTVLGSAVPGKLLTRQQLQKPVMQKSQNLAVRKPQAVKPKKLAVDFGEIETVGVKTGGPARVAPGAKVSKAVDFDALSTTEVAAETTESEKAHGLLSGRFGAEKFGKLGAEKLGNRLGKLMKKRGGSAKMSEEELDAEIETLMVESDETGVATEVMHETVKMQGTPKAYKAPEMNEAPKMRKKAAPKRVMTPKAPENTEVPHIESMAVITEVAKKPTKGEGEKFGTVDALELDEITATDFEPRATETGEDWSDNAFADLEALAREIERSAPKELERPASRAAKQAASGEAGAQPIPDEHFSLNNHAPLGAVEDFRPKFVNTQVEKRPLSSSVPGARTGMVATVGVVGVAGGAASASAAAKATEVKRPASTGNSAGKTGVVAKRPAPKTMRAGISPTGVRTVPVGGMNTRPVNGARIVAPGSKLGVVGAAAGAKLSTNGVKIAAPGSKLSTKGAQAAAKGLNSEDFEKAKKAKKAKKNSGIGMVFAIIATVLLGVVAGTVAFLLLPK